MTLDEATFNGYTIRYHKLASLIALNPCFAAFCKKGGDADVVPGVIEGGQKIWECSFDLCAHVASTSSIASDVPESVIELGCGGGLPGILAGKLGAKRIAFQDFNEEVIENVTKPNFEANVSGFDPNCVVSYFAGSWCDCLRKIPPQRFELVMASETVYNVDTFPDLHDLIGHILAPGGFALIAGKLIYFGLTGGTVAFVDYVKERKLFSADIIWTSEGDASVRELSFLLNQAATLTFNADFRLLADGLPSIELWGSTNDD